uniref:Uncharacterized protein n=1 Tax=Anopheles farauti TaxID=69004 RepID=A0A182QQ09_9DIPT
MSLIFISPHHQTLHIHEKALAPPVLRFEAIEIIHLPLGRFLPLYLHLDKFTPAQIIHPELVAVELAICHDTIHFRSVKDTVAGERCIKHRIAADAATGRHHHRRTALLALVIVVYKPLTDEILIIFDRHVQLLELAHLQHHVRVIGFVKNTGSIECAITYGTASASPKQVITGTPSSRTIKCRFMSRNPSRYACSIARFNAQSGPIRSTPSAQSCHRNRTGVWSGGTRNGITTTSSSSKPNMSGITPSMWTNTIIAIAYEVAIDIQWRMRAITAARPCGTRFTATAIPRDINQHRYIPIAAVYSSCGRAGVASGPPTPATAFAAAAAAAAAVVVGGGGGGGGAMLDEPIEPRAIPYRPIQTGMVSTAREPIARLMHISTSSPIRRMAKNFGRSYGWNPTAPTSGSCLGGGGGAAAPAAPPGPAAAAAGSSSFGWGSAPSR